MGFLDKAKQFASDNPDKMNQGIDKAGDAFDAKTGNKYEGQVDTAQQKAGEFLTGGGQQPQQPPQQ